MNLGTALRILAEKMCFLRERPPAINLSVLEEL